VASVKTRTRTGITTTFTSLILKAANLTGACNGVRELVPRQQQQRFFLNGRWCIRTRPLCDFYLLEIGVSALSSCLCYCLNLYCRNLRCSWTKVPQICKEIIGTTNPFTDIAIFQSISKRLCTEYRLVGSTYLYFLEIPEFPLNTT